MFSFPEIETPRLLLRVLTANDAAAVHRHFSDDDVTRFMDIESCRSRDEALEIIAFHTKDSGCRWGVFGKGTGALVGTCGYHCWVGNQAEIGFDLGTAHWGQGLMSEVLRAVIPFGFGSMNLERITASADPANERSIRLLTRLGFQPESDRDGLRWFQLLRDG